MIESEENFSYKNFFKNWGFFLAIITVLFFILFYSVYIARKPWQKYLQTQIENVLDEKDPNNWVLGNFKRIENPFCLSAACYEARNKKSGDLFDIVIIRIQTFYGPVAAVFTLDKEDMVQFIGYSSLHGRVQTQLLNAQSDKRLDYWKRKIPEILRPKGGKNEKH